MAMSFFSAPGDPPLTGLSAVQVAGVLGLLPHREGGYFRETYRSPKSTPTPAGPRPLCTSIVYMLTGDDPSRFHRLSFDEVWFFHAGPPVEMVFLDPLETVVLEPGAPQALAPAGRWMAARVLGSRRGEVVPPPECVLDCETEASGQSDPGPAWALVGCVVAPGFEYEDFSAGTEEDLLRDHPEAADFISDLA